jgi:hypothetical protein
MRLPCIVLLLSVTTLLSAQTTITIDAQADRHYISPDIYGVNFATTAQLLDLNVGLNRSGGNTTTRYNWQQNCANHARDWYYESLEHGPDVPAQESDEFIDATKAGSAQPMITIPMIGWVAKMGPNRQRLASFSIAKYGQQQDADWQWFPDAGNGILLNGQYVVNDKHDANTPADSTFMAGWVQHMVSKYGFSSSGGVRYYILDNEPSIWHGTHRDVRPDAPGMDEMLSLMLDYGAKIRAVDQGAQIIGPEEWGWSGYFFSGADQQYMAETGQYGDTPDRVAHGGWDYLPWMMAKLHEREMLDGRKPVDVFTIHYYPQSGEYSTDTSNGMQLMRNRSTRSLWDPNYTDESWIGDKVRLIPRFREWLDRYYPGTPLGITEYNWGAEEHINGGIAQADILGIFGRERLDLATLWVTPPTGSPAYNAVKMYRNYDGAQSTFGEVSVRATAPNPDNVSAFAAIRRSDGALTVMLINKQLATTASVALQIANYTPAGNAQRWQMTAAGIAAGSAVAPGSTISLPAQSVTLLVFPGTSDTEPPMLAITGFTKSESGLYTFTGTAGEGESLVPTTNAGGIASVTYHVSGTAPLDGTATGTTSWSFGPIALQNGWNHVSVTAYDMSGNPRTRTMLVPHEVMTPAPKPPASGKRRAVR